MEYKSVSAKISRDEVTLLKAFCDRKGTTPSSLIRELILRELGFPFPHSVAGINSIRYDKENDRFDWLVELDNGEALEVMRGICPSFLEDLENVISRGLKERASFIGKRKKASVPVPSSIIGRDGK